MCVSGTVRSLRLKGEEVREELGAANNRSAQLKRLTAEFSSLQAQAKNRQVKFAQDFSTSTFMAKCSIHTTNSIESKSSKLSN